MVVELYAIRDKVADEYGEIFMAKNQEIAMRNYSNVLDKIPKDDYKADYELYYMGVYDTELGYIAKDKDGLAECASQELIYKPYLVCHWQDHELRARQS